MGSIQWALALLFKSSSYLTHTHEHTYFFLQISLLDESSRKISHEKSHC